MTSKFRCSFDRFLLVINCSLILLISLIAVFSFFVGIFYDTDHFADTFFILGAAWRILEGLRPVIDFGHFYGGFISETLSWTMYVFGTHASVFYLHSIFLGCALIACAFLFSRTHMSPLGFSGVALVILTLLLTRYPLEFNDQVIRVISTHSFFYNRFAQAAMFVVTLFVIFKNDRKRREVFGGGVSGMLVGAVCLTKSTFVLVLPGLFIALLIMRRWFAAGGALIGLGLFVLVFDPNLQRFFGSLDYALAHVGESNGIMGLIRKSVQIPLYQPVALCATLFAVALCVKDATIRVPVASAIILAGTVVGMTATMGGNGSLGQLALPTLIALCIGCAELARKHSAEHEPVIRYISVILILAFATPHVANMLGAAAEGYSRKSERLIEHGPYARYLSVPEQQGESSGPTQYEMLADGITALRALGEPSQWGVVADSGITFEHALLAKPVAGYPLWQRASAPELGPDRALSDDIDIILLARGEAFGATSILRSKMTDKFTVCTISNYWEVYAHQRLALTNCAKGSN